MFAEWNIEIMCLYVFLWNFHSICLHSTKDFYRKQDWYKTSLKTNINILVL